MPDPDAPPADDGPTIPRPPSPAELDVLSGEQAMITDEWAPTGSPGMPRPNPGTPSTDSAAGEPVPDVPDA